MSRTVAVTLGTETAVATFYADRAPEITDATWELLPWSANRVLHARITDDEVFIDAPILTEEKENPVENVSAGEFGYYSGYPAYVWFYDDVQPWAPPNIIGRITENLDGFQREARKAWKETSIGMRMERGEE